MQSCAGFLFCVYTSSFYRNTWVLYTLNFLTFPFLPYQRWIELHVENRTIRMLLHIAQYWPYTHSMTIEYNYNYKSSLTSEVKTKFFWQFSIIFNCVHKSYICMIIFIEWMIKCDVHWPLKAVEKYLLTT